MDQEFESGFPEWLRVLIWKSSISPGIYYLKACLWWNISSQDGPCISTKAGALVPCYLCLCLCTCVCVQICMHVYAVLEMEVRALYILWECCTTELPPVPQRLLECLHNLTSGFFQSQNLRTEGRSHNIIVTYPPRTVLLLKYFIGDIAQCYSSQEVRW